MNDKTSTKAHLTSQPPITASSLEVAALLTMSGGFLDAFTYVGHGQVFANSMTGNMVLLGVLSATRDWWMALRHIPPIVAFLLGVFVAHLLRLPESRKFVHHPALSCLLLEIAFLAIASFLPPDFPDIPMVLGIAFVAAIQNSSFPKLETWSYNSVQTTGNLRRFAEGFFSATVPRFNPEALKQAKVFGFICTCFLIGAILGAITTERFQNLALWLPIVMLSVAWLRCRKLHVLKTS